jgi:hypothetical protein
MGRLPNDGLFEPPQQASIPMDVPLRASLVRASRTMEIAGRRAAVS